MIAVVTVLLAFPLGFFVRSHLNANVAYAIAYLWAFSYQGVALVREWVGGDTAAFPKDPGAVPLSYGIVAAAIFGIGFGLVAVGQRLGSKRRERRLVSA